MRRRFHALFDRPLLISPSAQNELLALTNEPAKRGVLDGVKGLLGVGGDEPSPQSMADYAANFVSADQAEVSITKTGLIISGGIAIFHIDGILLDRTVCSWGTTYLGYDAILAALNDADSRNDVTGIILMVDSPGGIVSSTLTELTDYMQARRSEADAKPLWAVCEMACSAAYWIASQADKIIGRAMAQIGSIGVIVMHEDYSEGYKKHGIKITPIQFGAHKTDGADFEPLSDDVKASIQTEVDEFGERFLSAVHAGRGDRFSAEDARATEARVYPAHSDDVARSALHLGLIDDIASPDEAFDDLQLAASAALTGPAATPSMETSSMNNSKFARQVAMVKAKATDDDDLKKQLRKLLDEHDERATDETEDDKSAETDEETASDQDEEQMASEDEEDASAEDEKEDETLARAERILNLPEAKGRRALAQKLAFTKGMTVAAARDLLKVAPKASTLGTLMQGQDPSGLSGNGGKATSDNQDTVARALRDAGLA